MMTRILFVLLCYTITVTYLVDAVSYCQNGTVYEKYYKGRIFPNHIINKAIPSMTSLVTASVHLCRHKCHQTMFCKAISFNKGTRMKPNCKLYSCNGLNQLLIPDETYISIFIIPVGFQFLSSGFTKAVPDLIEVAAKDEKPGTFVFRLPSGLYRIRLIHSNGGFICDPYFFGDKPMPFGCYYEHPNASLMMLVKDFRGGVIVFPKDFSDFEGDGMKTRYLSTVNFFPLYEGSTYSFWYFEDYENTTEENNVGSSSFEMFVETEM